MENLNEKELRNINGGNRIKDLLNLGNNKPHNNCGFDPTDHHNLPGHDILDRYVGNLKR